MKKIIIVCFSLILFCSCNDVLSTLNDFDIPKIDSFYLSADEKVHVLNISGHEYIIYDGYHSGNIIHAEHCPCKNN